MNYKYHKKGLNEITKELISSVVSECMESEMTSIAPLGASGETFLLHGSTAGGRKSVVSIRSYLGDPELLVTDSCGRFLFYGRFHSSLGAKFLSEYYWMIFVSLENLINTSVKNRNIKISGNASLTSGFDMIKLI